LFSRQRAGKTFLTLEPGEHVLPPSFIASAHTRVACLSMAGRLLVFPLAELKRQANGGRGLTLMDVDAKDPLISVAACGDTLRVLGSGRGAKPKDELLKGAALAAHEGKRARKGRRVEGLHKVQRVVA
jgi:topoisomerase-4 subunit A